MPVQAALLEKREADAASADSALRAHALAEFERRCREEAAELAATEAHLKASGDAAPLHLSRRGARRKPCLSIRTLTNAGIKYFLDAPAEHDGSHAPRCAVRVLCALASQEAHSESLRLSGSRSAPLDAAIRSGADVPTALALLERALAARAEGACPPLRPGRGDAGGHQGAPETPLSTTPARGERTPGLVQSTPGACAELGQAPGWLSVTAADAAVRLWSALRDSLYHLSFMFRSVASHSVRSAQRSMMVYKSRTGASRWRQRSAGRGLWQPWSRRPQPRPWRSCGRRRAALRPRARLLGPRPRPQRRTAAVSPAQRREVHRPRRRSVLCLVPAASYQWTASLASMSVDRNFVTCDSIPGCD